MSRTHSRFVKITMAGLVSFACLFANERSSVTGSGPLLSTAEAVIGRPLTPMSYAGVARRTTRRAVTYGAAAGAVYAAPVVVTPACVQAVDAYGRVYTRCY
jgi:hypothetical protein